MKTLTELEAIALAELRCNAEADAGDGWQSVYLPNCKSSLQPWWNSILAGLSKKGLYDREPGGDGSFGFVRGETT